LRAGIVVFLGAGCQTIESDLSPQGTSLATGSTMTLLVPVTVPANRARVGLPVKRSGEAASGYEVHCLFEVENVGKVSQEIPVGDYRVKKTETERTYFVDEKRGPYLVASTGLLLASDRATPMYQVTNIFFEPGQAADLYRLGCSRLGGRGTRYVTIEEMEALLSGVVEFEDPGAGAERDVGG
jgi:hypothetical protein